MQIRLLGPLTVLRADEVLPLPASRKVRGLLAYLALAPRPVGRSSLCELLWARPADPRGELRWALSRLRRIVDEPGRRRVYTRGDTVGLDLKDCHVDALELNRAAEDGIQALPLERLRALCALCVGDLLEGLEVDRSPAFNGWLAAQRRRCRDLFASILERLVDTVPAQEAHAYLDRWLEIAPFDRHVHETLLRRLARRGSIREGEEHVAATARRFAAEGLDHAPIRATWAAAKAGEAAEPAPSVDATPATRRRGSVAVMPFTDLSRGSPIRGGAADGLAYDLTARLAKLRSLFVIAQGTAFTLHERRIGAAESGRILDVDYVVSGSIRSEGGRLHVTAELAEAQSARVVWAETFAHRLDETLLVLDEIGDQIVASVAAEIEAMERNRAILMPPSSLDAWGAYHRALWHMYRYRKADNEQARDFFQTAVRLDPTFSRAYAGLSFTHFQGAFQSWEAREPQIERAHDTAVRAVLADERDPAAHWALGRSLWLRGRPDESLVELEHSVHLSPNFALGHYNLAFVHSLVGDPRTAVASSDYSRHLSPFDPMLFGMLATRAMALVRLGQFEEAAQWAVKAAARPNVFPHIHALAALTLALAGSLEEAHAHATVARRVSARYDLAEFLVAFPFDSAVRGVLREGAKLLGWAAV